MKNPLYILIFALIVVFILQIIYSTITKKDTLILEEPQTATLDGVIERRPIALGALTRAAYFADKLTTAAEHPEINELLTTEAPPTLDLSTKSAKEYVEEVLSFRTNAGWVNAWKQGKHANEAILEDASTALVKEEDLKNYTIDPYVE